MRFVKEAGAEAVKIEGGERRLELIARLTEAEIPVMGHVGLTPQSVNAMGGYRVQGKTPVRRSNFCGMRGRSKLRVRLLSCWRRAARAGGGDHAQRADSHDWHRRRPGLRRTDPGAARYAGIDVSASRRNSRGNTPTLAKMIAKAAREYCADVQSGTFPSDAESYHAPAA